MKKRTLSLLLALLLLASLMPSAALAEKSETDVAYDGLEAYEKAKVNFYDCIIMDIMMPKMSGYEAVEEIKNSEEKSDTKYQFDSLVIFLSE